MPSKRSPDRGIESVSSELSVKKWPLKSTPRAMRSVQTSSHSFPARKAFTLPHAVWSYYCPRRRVVPLLFAAIRMDRIHEDAIIHELSKELFGSFLAPRAALKET